MKEPASPRALTLSINSQWPIVAPFLVCVRVNSKFSQGSWTRVLSVSTFFHIYNPFQLNFVHKGFSCTEEKKKSLVYWVTNPGNESDMRAGGFRDWEAWDRSVKNLSQDTHGQHAAVTSYTWPAVEQDLAEHWEQHFPGTRTTISSLTPREGQSIKRKH